MENNASLSMNWIKVGAFTGLLTTVVYPLLIFIEMPQFLTIFLACTVGPLLSVASVGLYHFMKIHRKTVSLQIATISNIIAGTIFNMMLIVQLARRLSIRYLLNTVGDESLKETLGWISKGVHTVQSGLDISWDVYIAVGTFLFAINMLQHPRLGRILGSAGTLLAVLLLALNLYKFPTAPAEAGLVDLGPVVGLWYLSVTIQILRSLKWAEESLANT